MVIYNIPQGNFFYIKIKNDTIPLIKKMKKLLLLTKIKLIINF